MATTGNGGIACTHTLTAVATGGLDDVTTGGSKRHRLHAVELSQRSGKPCANCVDLSHSQQWASRPCGPAGLLTMLLIKAGDVETYPGPTTTRKQVWSCDICHRQIQVRKQISIRCNRIEHWVHLKCTGIRLAQYTDRTCHQPK